MITAFNTDYPGPEYPPEWDEPEKGPCFVCGMKRYVAEMIMCDGGEYVCERCADENDFEVQSEGGGRE